MGEVFLTRLFAGLVAVFPVFGQPAFDVASVKPSPPLAAKQQFHRQSWGEVTGKVDLTHITLQSLLLRAYDAKFYQLSGPSWIGNEYFDIVATAPEATSKDQIALMLRTLLAERFKLKVHRETQQSPVYALVVSKGGPKLEDAAATIDPAKPAGSAGGLKRNTDGTIDFSRGQLIRGGLFGDFRLSAATGFDHFEFLKITMKQLAEFLSGGMVGLPVVDSTDLTGSYRVPLDVSFADMLASTPAVADKNPSPTALDPIGGSVFESLGKLGLKLDAAKGPIEKLIVDHVEKIPTEN